MEIARSLIVNFLRTTSVVPFGNSAAPFRISAACLVARASRLALSPPVWPDGRLTLQPGSPFRRTGGGVAASVAQTRISSAGCAAFTAPIAVRTAPILIPNS